jgi:hypothetical protein
VKKRPSTGGGQHVADDVVDVVIVDVDVDVVACLAFLAHLQSLLPPLSG